MSFVILQDVLGKCEVLVQRTFAHLSNEYYRFYLVDVLFFFCVFAASFMQFPVYLLWCHVHLPVCIYTIIQVKNLCNYPIG